MNTLVSIIIPVYNTEKYLDRCVQSVLNQTYKNVEILLVNDGSTDNSLDLCKKYSELDRRIKLISQANAGLTAARLTGMNNSRGDCIAFIDSDDYLDKDFVIEHLTNIKRTGADISISSYYYLNEKQEIQYPIFRHEKNIYLQNDYVKELILPRIYSLEGDSTSIPDFLWLRMFKRQCISPKCFVSERDVFTEDVFFNLEALKNSFSVSVIEKRLYYYCYNIGSLTHVYRPTKTKMELNRLVLLKRKLNEWNISDEYRIELASFKSLWGCVDNAAVPKNYLIFKKEMSDLYNNIDLNKYFKRIRYVDLRFNDLLLLMLYRLRFTFLIYYIKTFDGSFLM